MRVPSQRLFCSQSGKVSLTPLSEPERQLLVWNMDSTKANAFCELGRKKIGKNEPCSPQKAFAFVEYGTRSCLSGSDRGVICFLIGIFVRKNGTSTEETLSSVLFTSIGQVTLQTAYGHLLVPLNIPSLKRAFDHFADLQSAINKLITSNTDAYNHRQSELKNLRSKLDIIHHLALTKR